MPYCTNRKHVSGKIIDKDQRISRSLCDSVGPCKTIPLERMVGRMAAEELGKSKPFDGDGLSSIIDLSITIQRSLVPSYEASYTHTKVS